MTCGMLVVWVVLSRPSALMMPAWRQSDGLCIDMLIQVSVVKRTMVLGWRCVKVLVRCVGLRTLLILSGF